MNIIESIFKKWLDVLAKPQTALKKESKSRKINEAIIHLLAAGFIAGLIAGVFPNASALETKAAFGEPAFFAVMLILTPIFFVIFWAVSSAVMYIFARFLKGKGNLVQQSHIIALVNAPFAVLNAVVNAIPVLDWLLSLVVGVYSLYVLSLGLKEVHKYSMGRAVFTWLVPLLLLLLIIVLTAAFFTLG